MNSRSLVFAVILLGSGAKAFGQNPGPEGRVSQEHVIFFSGEVVLEDGSPPPDTVLLQRVCNGHAHTEAWTDLKGHFSFKVEGSENGSAVADASQASGPPADVNMPMGNASQYTHPVTSSLRDCDLQAVLPGFQATGVGMALKSTLDGGHIGPIVLHPLSRGSVLTVSMTTMAAPPGARKAYEKGLIAARGQKWEAAAGSFLKAVTIYPRFAIAWHELGLARQKNNDLAGAVEAWKEAVKSDPKYVKPYGSLAAVADARQDWMESEKYSREWIQLDPDDFPAAYLLNAIASARLEKPEAAEHSAREGLRVDKDHKVPRLDYVLGLILTQKRAYGEAAKWFRAYLELAPNANDAAIVRQEVARLDLAAGSATPQ
jgi:tetratricopeptide (TPR) repeat protein